MKLHHSITFNRIIDACERHFKTLDNPGFCIECGAEQEGVEPDAREYVCEACGAKAVYGCEDLLFEVEGTK